MRKKIERKKREIKDRKTLLSLCVSHSFSVLIFASFLSLHLFFFLSLSLALFSFVFFSFSFLLFLSFLSVFLSLFSLSVQTPKKEKENQKATSRRWETALGPIPDQYRASPDPGLTQTKSKPELKPGLKMMELSVWKFNMALNASCQIVSSN